MLNKVKLLLKQIRALFPSKLPVGMTEFEKWADSFSEIYPLATQNKNSVRFTLATSIMHLAATDAYKSKYHFYLLLEAAAAKQIAGATFVKIKEDEAKRIADEKAKEDVTAQSAV